MTNSDNSTPNFLEALPDILSLPETLQTEFVEEISDRERFFLLCQLDKGFIDIGEIEKDEIKSYTSFNSAPLAQGHAVYFKYGVFEAAIWARRIGTSIHCRHSYKSANGDDITFPMTLILKEDGVTQCLLPDDALMGCSQEVVWRTISYGMEFFQPFAMTVLAKAFPTNE